MALTTRAWNAADDGFGGGSTITSNLIFNSCRSSGDHGPINAWGRAPWLTDVKDGTPSFTAKMNHVTHNFIIANYGASQGFDTGSTHRSL